MYDLKYYSDCYQEMTERQFSRKYSSVPLLSPGVQVEKKQWFCLNAIRSLGNHKAILILLSWEFVTGLIYNLLMKPSAYLHHFTNNTAVFLACIVAVLFLVLTPLASFVADVKFSRFKTLIWSTYCMIVSSTFTLLSGGIVTFAVSDFSFFSDTVLGVLYISILAYLCGKIVFLANILQFGTDQLRDAPTCCSVLFLYAYYWCDNFSSLLTLSTNIPGHEVIINHFRITIPFDKLEASLYGAVIFISIFLSVIIILILHKKKHWLFTEGIGGNPYRLTWDVVKFALQHKKPLRRSAFTFCENSFPSRLDFGKQRYGGPFTTEQVEDVKVLFNMVKVFLSLGPVFFLDLCATIAVRYHLHLDIADFSVNNSWKVFFLHNGILSPLLTLIWIPLLFKLYLSNWLPNMFKRIGLSIILLSAFFALCLIYYAIGYSSQNYNKNLAAICQNVTDSFMHTHRFAQFSATYVVVLQNIMSSIYHMLLYISVWELICCQSPQFMKGLLFGLFYTIRAFYHFLAAAAISSVYYFWKSQLVGCNFIFYIVNLSLGLLFFLIFVMVTRKYQYRKRDDICNIYQYAEDYYSIKDGNNQPCH